MVDKLYIKKTNRYLVLALLIGIIFHGTAIFFTLEKTYDALIHLFFADHYANSWFEPWNFEWYTGFTVTSYPPLVHQLIGLFSYIGGLKFGMFTVAFMCIILFITGVYKYTLLVTSNTKVAGYAAFMCVFSSSFVETLHLFGQLPSIMGVSILMHSFPKIYLWVRTRKPRILVLAISLISVTVSSHHVTPIFGMVFFIFPLLGMAVMDIAYEEVGDYKKISFKIFFDTTIKNLKPIIIFGGCSLVVFIFCILPYWINTKNNPITQVAIPHGSRDNFLEVTSSGLAFFVIPWGTLLFIWPYLFSRYYTRRYMFYGISFTLLTILGTGGTTPIAEAILGENAFNILTLDRFTLWASIMSLPIFGEFTYRLVEGDLGFYIRRKYSTIYHRTLTGFLVTVFILTSVFTLNLGYFRPGQPPAINMLPIVNFLKADSHDAWRFLTLGFGDQMAWLSAQTDAYTVDGNYHSARRLPELTTRAVERLENSKFLGTEGIGSLQQFLTIPEKYNLKYIFSNDKFYDPILYFCGWQRLPVLENGINVWEKLGVPPMTSVIARDEIGRWQKIMWGTIPISTLLIAGLLTIQMPLYNIIKNRKSEPKIYMEIISRYRYFSPILVKVLHRWILMVVLIVCYFVYKFYIKNYTHYSPHNVVNAYYDHLDFKRFKEAHSLLNPKDSISMEQYMMEISVADGVLNSYAKMDSISVKVIRNNRKRAMLSVHTKWITPLRIIEKEEMQTTIKIRGKWYIDAVKPDTDIPPDKLFVSNETTYYNQGRRKITSEMTHHEDIIRQPIAEVLSAKLVHNNGEYFIVGEVQNTDNTPADIALKASLYSKNDKKLASYNAKSTIKHKLMPKETTSFIINFEDTAWKKNTDVKPKTYDPDTYFPVYLNEIPSSFDLHVSSNTANRDLYKRVTISHLRVKKDIISGTLFNYGTQDATIPQLLVSYYNKEKELMWVEHFFVRNSVRQQRKSYFEYPITEICNVEIIDDENENFFINGLPDETTAKKNVPFRIKGDEKGRLLPIVHDDFWYVKIELNNYIGNPI